MNLFDAQSILIYGGTFDPPTRAHIELPMVVRERLGADLVAYVPARMSPFKTDDPPTDPSHRVAMLEAALDDNEHAKVLTEEIDRTAEGTPSYTIDTIEYLRDWLPVDVTMRLLIGGDQMAEFLRWKSFEKIVEMAEPVVMVRPPQTRESLLETVPESQRGFWVSRLIDVPPMDVSSTEVRRRVAANEPIDDLVVPAVEKYIRKHKLYRNKS